MNALDNRSTSRRVLMIRYEGNPFAVRMSKTILTLLDAGYEIDILVPHGKKGISTYRSKSDRPLEELVNLHFFRTRLTLPWRVSKLLDKSMLQRDPAFESKLEQLVRTREYTAIVVKDSHKLPAVFRLLDRNGLATTPVVCDMYENVTEQTADYFIRFASFRRRMLTRLVLAVPRLRDAERRYLPRCDRIFVVVEETRRYLLDRYDLQPERVSVVENVELLEQFDAIETGDAFADHLEPGSRLVSYVGSIGAHRGIETFLGGIAGLTRDQKKNTAFAIVGARENTRERIERMAKNLGIGEELRVLGYVSHDDAMRWIKRSQVGVIPHSDTPFIRTTIPNKLFQYMAAGALVLSCDVGPLGRIVRETDCGFVFPAHSADALAEKLALALEDDDVIATKGRNGRAAVDRVYSWEHQGAAYRDYFESLTRGRGQVRPATVPKEAVL